MNKLFLTLLIFITSLPTFGQSRTTSEWLFIYYMPYDNNLSFLGEGIIERIKDGIISDKVVAVVQADFADTIGTRRYIISDSGIIKSVIKQEYSAYTNSYQKYLDWVSQNFKYKKSAVIFLDHGGKLDEICLDEKPQKSFLKVDSVATVIEKFNLKQNKKIDLLFLQVCTKGSIEPLYQFKNSAKYTLASQTLLGAPNYYYEKLFNKLSKKPHVKGLKIASLICKYERDDMYNSFTCINNLKFDAFKEKYVEFIDNMHLQQDSIQFKSKPISHVYADEKYWDLKSFISNIKLTNQNKIKIRDELIKFIDQKLIVIHKKNPEEIIVNNYSGLSILSIEKDYQLKMEKYNHLLFFNKMKKSKTK